jgi:hypothetical protein
MRLTSAILAAGLLASLATANRLNENCVVSVLNRTVRVNADGSWVLPNVPANFGLVRARATCVTNGITTSGESDLFLLGPNQTINLPHINLGPSTPVPNSVTIQSPVQQLTQQVPNTQLTVTATYPSGPPRNITQSSTGTTYNVSNPAIATISPNGLVTAVSSGTVLVQAVNEGTQGILSIQVVLTGDTDGDGIPDDVEIREGLNPNDPSDALADFDGDGLNNRQEIELGTDIRNRDTDGDGLSDGEEVNGINGFTSNPLLVDTDGDGVNDYLEAVVARTNPRDPNSVNFAAVTSRIDVTPTQFTITISTLNPSGFTQLNVVATLADNTTLDLTTRARGTTYSSSDLNVCNFGAQDGRIFAGLQGNCMITVVAAGRTVMINGQVRSFTPLALSQIQIPGYANNVDVQGGYAYVAAGATGLQVVSVSDPNAPAIVASRDTPGNANDVRVVGNLAYVADSNALVIINIANPLAPQIVGSVATPGEAMDVWVTGNHAYLATGASGLTIVNITNPAAPIVASTTAAGGIARGVAVRENIAVVVSDNTNTLRTFDVTNPSAPVQRGSVNLTGSLKDVHLNGTLAAVAAYTGGAHFVDISNPALPVLRGSVPGSAPNGFVPRDVEFGTGFAIFAEQLFPNAVPFVDFGDPANPGMRGIIDFAPLGDYAGTGIAVSGPFVYMTGESFIVGPENGVNGNTRLFVGQYLPREDLAGVPPTVNLLPIPGGNARIQGETVTISAETSDDVAVVSVNFLVNGNVAFTDSSAPYEYSLPIPLNASSLNIQAEAFDLANNRGVSPIVNLTIGPDPLTTVTGRVLDENGAPLAGALVTVTGDFTGMTGAGGNFQIPSVTTVNGNIVANAAITQNDIELRGSSQAFAPVRGGTTNVGDIRVFSARWETNIGPCWSSSDDTFTPVAFNFPFYGTARTTAFVGTNGYITFNSGDNTFSESLPAFNNRPRIAAFFDDLFGRSQGCAHINQSLPGRVVVTYNNVQHYSFGGSYTIQMILFSDGRIQFGYRGIARTDTGVIVGLTPGPSSPAQSVNFSEERSVEIPAGTAVYEYFLASNPFDLDGSFILFTPRPNGGYSVRTIVNPAGAANVLLTGGPGNAGLSDEGAVSMRLVADELSPAAVTPQQLANSEVEVSASTNVRYRGMTNTDRGGNFALSNVPRGGIHVVVKKKGVVVGEGSAVLPPFVTTQRSINVVVTAPIEAPQKQQPAVRRF